MTGGTLNAVGGAEIGGAVTGATKGSILFADPDGILAQNNQNFNWANDTSTQRIMASLGTNKVTNGTFTGGVTGWSLGSGWTYSANAVHHSSNGTSALSVSSTPSINGEMYKVCYEVLSLTAGSVVASMGGVSMPTRSANGVYVDYVVALSSASLSFAPTNTARLSIDNVTVQKVSGGNLNVGGLSFFGDQMVVSKSASNTIPATTRHVQYKNPTGTNTWFDFDFGSTNRSNFGADSSGAFKFYASGGSYFELYSKPSNALYMYSFPTALVHIGYGAFSNGVHAGSNAEPPSRLTSSGGTGLKTEYLKTDTTLSNAHTEIFVNGDNNNVCGGTITRACTYWTSQADCEKWNAHGGCAWSAGSPCSDFNYESGMSVCAETTGCTVSEISCNGPSDETSCLAQNDSYGGSCSWNSSYGDCNVFDGDEYSCNNNFCTWDSGSNTCSGSYNTGSACDGNYNSGDCAGDYNSGCFGSSACVGILTSGNCGFEEGCTWSSGITITLPLDTGTSFLRFYEIKNVGATASVTVLPNTSQTVNGTSSLSIAIGKARRLVFAYFTEQCSIYSETNESTCTTGHAGCTWRDCSNYSDQQTCDGSGCYWNIDTSSCDGGATCNGTFPLMRDWSVMGGIF